MPSPCGDELCACGREESGKGGRTGAMLPLLAAALAAMSYSLTVPTPATARKRLSGEMARRFGCCTGACEASAAFPFEDADLASLLLKERSGTTRRERADAHDLESGSCGCRCPTTPPSTCAARRKRRRGGRSARDACRSANGWVRSREGWKMSEDRCDSPHSAIVAARDEDDRESVCGGRLWGGLSGLRREVGRVRQRRSWRHGLKK